MIILALPSGVDAATAAATADIHRKLWDYLSSYARIRLAPDHIVHHVLRQLSELFSQQQCSGNNIGGGDGDDRYDLLYSVVSDIVNMLGSRKDKNPSGNQTMYFDLVSLWYGETLRSHRGHRQHGYHPRLHLAEDEMFAILNSGKAAGASAASSSSSSPQWSGARDNVDPLLDPNSMEDVDFDLDVAAINSYLLLDLGWQTAWHDRSIPDACAALLQGKEYTGAPPDETEVNCLTAMALYERAQCTATGNLFPCPPSTATVPLTPDGARETEQRQRRLVRAQWLLSEAVSLDWDLSGASIYNFEGLLLLQELCAEIGDWNGLEAVRARSRECLDILFGEWGV
ncbi:hypothetical protein PFICI_07000 [Pestalotiopsis fici W106-1]|uniref:Uncharacterized protein n=1 Tax=Pestalotiopsis fici (strain W106-1 / CGMCC3.15140) TaxID=1229662 RepID=W3X7A3_PESFW|nr:uncharacterized protein PFICI_07000 [Pestalotiopsis fici W106-1]ETS81998.1 hypothetical protein PFICI_07000 [Pestalotiopsis fici W106-1]